MKKGSPADKSDMALTAVELERAWSNLRVDRASAAYRDKLPTPLDENPLRYLAETSDTTRATRDKLPTLRVIDPLLYDLEP